MLVDFLLQLYLQQMDANAKSMAAAHKKYARLKDENENLKRQLKESAAGAEQMKAEHEASLMQLKASKLL